MAKPYTLERISPTDVAFSPSNPRGEGAADIAKDPAFEQLKDSVYQFGVLVPIVVHRQGKRARKPFRLVDGERRLRAAIETNLDKIPAHVLPVGQPMGDLVQAFHIHMLRKQWSQTAQTRALKRVLQSLKCKSPDADEAELSEKLRSMTSCSDTRLADLRRAARYPDSVLDEVQDGVIVFSHLVQIEESLVEQLERHFPSLLRDLGKDKVRQAALDKARKKILTGTRALMLNIVPVISRAKSKKEKAYAKALLRDFVNKPSMTAETVLKKFERKYPHAQDDLLELVDEIIEFAETLQGKLVQLEAQQMVSFPKKAKDLKAALDELRQAMTQPRQVLRGITR